MEYYKCDRYEFNVFSSAIKYSGGFIMQSLSCSSRKSIDHLEYNYEKYEGNTPLTIISSSNNTLFI